MTEDGCCDHVISHVYITCLYLIKCLWTFNETAALYPRAQGQMVLWVRPKGNWKNKLELLRERWPKAQLFL